MECNKEEAIKAMDIAKRKIAENDYNGAKKVATKAQNLYPKLDGLKQVMMLIDVYISAGNKIIGGDLDWYAILGVDPLADEDVVKKQYKRLALLLHPDKNKCEGAEGAFKLVLAAWCLLSDKVKRIAYDQKRKFNEVKPKRSRKQKQPPKKPPNQPKQPPNQPKQSPQQRKQPPNQQKQPPNQPKQPPNQPKQPPNQPKQPPNQPKQPPNQPSSSGRSRSNKPTSKVSTFWTMCNKCRAEYEYVRVFFLNKSVLCRNCRGTFKATEKEKTATEKEEARQATNKNTNGASSCGKDSSLSTMGSFKSGNVANKAEERGKREVRESEEATRGISNSEVEERVFKKLRTDDYAEASSGIKV
ncbi:PREDICTED: J domain-containing protein DDB_G0295729-like [Camelina sativa]|uniref:J domain-containing protein DDB_G0295729-like n=1 Tax=Camelina sativa TaxID=90675 RepID=A0ABM1QN56_CAMSA|nr:PREDICTED: J domain-containing protein DDB_G0295729-like [Camelina sativa]XP_019088194.1 PREDICTED: J domain-containing protein DDB_G0295729-like [Camelina sativa]